MVESSIGPKPPPGEKGAEDEPSRWRFLWAGVAVLAIPAVSAAIGLFFSGGGSAPSRLTGAVTVLGPVDVSIDSTPGRAISPVCGCYKVPHDKEWRGVSFATRSLRISGHHIPAGYYVSAATPEPARWQAGRLFFSAQLLTFESLRPMKSRPVFDAHELLTKRAPRGWKLLGSRTLRSQRADYFRTSRPLNVALLGPVPIGAWVPSGGSRIHLGFKQGLFPSQGTHGELTETEHGPRGYGPLGVPLTDVLGPDVIWSRDPRLEFEAPGGRVRLPHTAEGRQKVTALLIRRAPFATRIAPVTIVHLPPRLRAGGSGMLMVDPPPHGSYRLRLGGPPVTGDAYAKVASHLKTHEFIKVKNVTEWGIAPHPSDGRAYELGKCKHGLCTIKDPQPAVIHGRMGFRYPPEPPAEDSFTVFGPLRYLHLSQTEGHLSSESHPLAAPTDLELRNVKLLGTAAPGVLAIPAGEGHHEVSFSASPSGSVDGEPLVTPHGTSFWSIFVPVMSALVGLCGLYAIIAGARRRQKRAS
ncbi:MAG: hypothetical protein QM729_07385 [Solirubrobacterales bacterium]